MAAVSPIQVEELATAVCPVCENQDTTVPHPDVEDFEYGVGAAGAYEMRRCAGCASEFVYPRPTDQELVAFYPTDYHCYNEDHGWLAQRLVDRRAKARGELYRRLAPGPNPALFDVGTGDCRHFDELKRFVDMEFSGIEISPDMAAKARERGYDVLDGTLEAADISEHVGRYDIVSMNHVLEHVVDPDEVLRRCFRLLKPGGVLLGQLPTASCWGRKIFGRYWGGYHFPRHLQLFSRSGLRQLIGDAGFRDAQVTSALHIQSAISVQNMLVGRGSNVTLNFGRSRWFGLFMLAVAPFEIVAKVMERSGIVDFQAQKPTGPQA